MSRRRKRLLILIGAGCFSMISAAIIWNVLKWYREMMCLANVHQLGLVMINYAADHDERFPPSFGALLKEGDWPLRLEYFVCPSSGKSAPVPCDFPADFKTGERDLLDSVEDWGTYVMVKGLKHAASAETIIIYEKAGNHGGKGRACYFDSGEVKWLTEAEFQKHMKAQETKLRDMR